MKDIKAVIFDMDGVIFDTERIYLKDWEKIFEEYGYDFKDEMYINLMGTGRKKVKEQYKKIFGQDIPIDEMYVRKDKMLYEAIKRGIPLKEGVEELIGFLKVKKLKICLATSAKRDRLEEQFLKSSISKNFDSYVCGDDVINSKPSPEIFLKAAELINVSPENCVVIEDSGAGIKAAFNAKMIPFHVKDLKEADDNIRLNAYKCFNNLLEIKKELSDNFKFVK